MRLKDFDCNDYINCTAVVKFIITDIAIKTTRKDPDRHYLELTIRDKHKQLVVRCFRQPDNLEEIRSGIVYEGVISTQIYNEDVSPILEQLISIDDETIEDYLPWTDNPQENIAIYEKAMKSLEGTKYGAIALELYKKYKDRFQVVPAGKSMHHTEFGGCIFHTSIVAINCSKIADTYKNCFGYKFIDKRLLICAALLHDIAKAMEYEFDSETGNVGFSRESIYDSHITQAIKDIDRIAIKLGIEDSEEVKNLTHCILSHHGSPEHGSPKSPMMPEAVILNMLDTLDAKMWVYNNTYRDLGPGEYKTVRLDGKPSVVYRARNK